MRKEKTLFWLPIFGALAPILLGIVGWLRADHGDLFTPSAVILPIALALTLWPVMLRASRASGKTSREILQRAVLDAAQDMTGTCITTFLLALGVTVSLATGYVIVWALDSYLAAVAATSLTLFLTRLPAIQVLDARAKGHPQRAPSMGDLASVGWLFAPAACAVLAIAMFATYEPLPLQVITDGRGIQPVRGMLRNLGERESLSTPTFVVEATHDWQDRAGLRHSVRVRPRDHAPYDIASAYPPSEAWLRLSSCGTDCEHVLFQGPDWSMSLQLHEDGTRRDDTISDRVLARVGSLGTGSLVATALVLLLMVMRIAGVALELRELTGRRFRHRFEGTLRGENVTIEGGVLTSEHATITLLDGAVTLLLPRSIPLLARDRALTDPSHAEVVVLMHEAPEFATHRTGPPTFPHSAKLILGAPERIEVQALGEIAARSIPHMALGGLLVSLLLFAMLLA